MSLERITTTHFVEQADKPMSSKADKPLSSEKVQTSYREEVETKLKESRLGKFFGYDQEGYLCLLDENEETKIREPKIRLADLGEYLRTPIQIIDTRIIQDNVVTWKEMCSKAKEETGFEGKLILADATKANTFAGVEVAAIASGADGLEISSQVGAKNTNRLLDRRLIPQDTLIISNGYKPNPDLESDPEDIKPPEGIVFEGDINSSRRIYEEHYIEMLSSLHFQRANLIVVIDTPDELNRLAQTEEFPLLQSIDENKEVKIEKLKVGLRMKLYDKATSDEEERHLKARHGMDVDELRKTAAVIADTDNLELKTLHAMVSAAQKISIKDMVDTLSYATDVFFELQATNPELTDLDMGGGVPPLSEEYDHEGFLRELLTTIQNKVNEKRKLNPDIKAPNIVFEFGSFIAEDSGFYIGKILTTKSNSIDQNGNPERWLIGDISPILGLPDVSILGREFPLYAGNNVDNAATDVYYGGLTCDKDDTYPSSDQIHTGKTIRMPEIGMDEIVGGQYIVFFRNGAYQRNLTGGLTPVGHSEQTPMGEAFLYNGPDGKLHCMTFKRPTVNDALEAYGFGDENLDFLRDLSKGIKAKNADKD